GFVGLVDQRRQDQDEGRVHFHVEPGAERALQPAPARQPAIDPVEDERQTGERDQQPGQARRQQGLAEQAGHQRGDTGARQRDVVGRAEARQRLMLRKERRQNQQQAGEHGDALDDVTRG
ncbi:hypothetical protein RZS08_56295, partial [Arthrospira platensis SPKY1]|nr:hypothetical protein [Arthrospira platensis SPKY1]